ncbi:MAG: hypothetical protein ACOH2F_20280 [Cellulomonas sp.]
MATSPSSSNATSGLRLWLVLAAPDDVVSEGDALRVSLRAAQADDVVAIVETATVELVRTLTYAYRRGNAYGSSTTAIEQVETVVDHAPMDGFAGLAPGEVLEHEVKLTVPADGPGTTAGKIIQVRWFIRARIRVTGRPEAVAERAITVRSRALRCEADATTPPDEAARRGVTMSFDELSTRTILPGIPLTGILHIAATRAVPARMVRIELVLREVVDHGPGACDDPYRSPADDGKESQSVVARTVVACRMFSPGQCLDVPFSLDVPSPLPAPSLQLAGFRVHWELRGVVDLPLRLDPRITLGLVGATAASW